MADYLLKRGVVFVERLGVAMSVLGFEWDSSVMHSVDRQGTVLALGSCFSLLLSVSAVHNFDCQGNVRTHLHD